MSMRSVRHSISASLLAGILCWPAAASAQTSRPTRPADPPGIDVFAGVGAAWSSTPDTFEALDLATPGIEVGGGVRFTGLWRKLFIQGSGYYWSDSGERAFVDDDGNVFPVGIELDVDATYLDATVGWKDALRNDAGRITFLTYVGGGAGVVRYSESSPFAADGDDVDETKPSYHFLAGAEVPVGSIFAIAIEGRYRIVPGLLGDDGVSAVFDEDLFGGFTGSVGVRIQFGGPKRVVAPVRPPAPPASTRAEPGATARGSRLDGGMILENAPVFLLPDATRTPLRTLSAGTSVRVLEEKGDWVRIEFRDNQYGARVGFVQRKYIQVRD
jgi:opacity protein-like surface antigen